MKNFRKALLGIALTSMMLTGCGEQESEVEVGAYSYQSLVINYSLDDYKDKVVKIMGTDYYAVTLSEYAKNNDISIPSKDIYVNAMDSSGYMHGFILDNANSSYVLLGSSNEEDTTVYPALYANEEIVEAAYKLYIEENPFKNTIKGEISIANYGVMEFELYPNVAPTSVENFKKLVEEGFYDGMIIHRIADLAGEGSDYIIQMGGFESGAYQYDRDTKAADTITGEFLANGFYNALNHSRGVMAMARSTAKNSASSQFYLVDDGCEFLDNNYATFGKITSNLEVLDKLTEAEVDDTYCWPLEEIQIEYIKLK